MTRPHTAAAIILALALAACGSNAAQSAQGFIASHTKCPDAVYASPQAAPDGQQIIYQVTLSGRSEIRAMNTLGGGDRLLVGGAIDPLLSPDGRWLLYSPVLNPGRVSFSLLNLASGQARPIPAALTMPSWSPDSRWIVYPVAAGSQGVLTKMEVATGRVVGLSANPSGQGIGDIRPAWSPGPGTAGDGSLIAFISDRAGAPAIYLMDAGGGHVRRLADEGGDTCPAHAIDDYTPLLEAWRPDGGQLVYSYLCAGGPELRITRIDGTPITNMAYPTQGVHRLSWLPDGSRMMVLESQIGGGNLYITDGSGTILNTISSWIADPSWLPSQGASPARIVYVGLDSAGEMDIFSMAADGTDVRQLTNNPGAGGFCPH